MRTGRAATVRDALEAIPEGAEFGHSCRHGSGPHWIKVLIFKSHNEPKLYEQLRAWG
jgi:hypothetical protein